MIFRLNQRYQIQFSSTAKSLAAAVLVGGVYIVIRFSGFRLYLRSSHQVHLLKSLLDSKIKPWINKKITSD